MTSTRRDSAQGDWFAAVTRHAVAPLWAAWEQSPYLRHCRDLRGSQYASRGEIEARQLAALKEQAEFAYAHSPLWRERFDAARLLPSEIRSFEDYRRVPLLTKDDLRQHGRELLTHQFPVTHVHSTSGSNGRPVKVHVDDDAQQWRRACTIRSDEWSGWRFGERVAMVWGNPEYLHNGWRGRLRNSLLERASYLDTLKMDEAAIERFGTEQQRRRPTLLLGHAHSLFLLAEFLKERPRCQFHPRGIISTAMVLHDWQREVIEAVFGCHVTNRYGCEEVSLIACQCEARGGLHINCDNVYVEILAADGEPAPAGEPGSVVVTDLTNRAMPLLRYKVGDVAVATEDICSCGRQLPLLTRVEGREADYVVTADGNVISGISLTENFAVLIPGIAQLQIVQERVDDFLFRIVRSDDFNQQSAALIRSLVADRFGPNARYQVEFVDGIPQEPSGKYRFCISRVDNPFTRSQRTEEAERFPAPQESLHAS